MSFSPWPLDILPSTLRWQYQRPYRRPPWSAPSISHATPVWPWVGLPLEAY